MCGGCYLDVLQHMLRECHKTSNLRLRLQHKLKFYNGPKGLDITNKVELFALAINRKRVFLKIFCEFLIETSNQ